jgi:hypothetical protein
MESKQWKKINSRKYWSWSCLTHDLVKHTRAAKIKLKKSGNRILVVRWNYYPMYLFCVARLWQLWTRIRNIDTHSFIHDTAIMKHNYPAGTQNGKLINSFIQENISHWATHYSFFYTHIRDFFDSALMSTILA